MLRTRLLVILGFILSRGRGSMTDDLDTERRERRYAEFVRAHEQRMQELDRRDRQIGQRAMVKPLAYCVGGGVFLLLALAGCLGSLIR
jgi:hypothetical protein